MMERVYHFAATALGYLALFFLTYAMGLFVFGVLNWASAQLDGTDKLLVLGVALILTVYQTKKGLTLKDWIRK